jgi:hypothetical protein
MRSSAAVLFSLVGLLTAAPDCQGQADVFPGRELPKDVTCIKACQEIHPLTKGRADGRYGGSWS